VEQEPVRFVITNDPDHNFDVIQEAWIGDHEVADVRQIDGKWQISFFSESGVCELNWEVYMEIHRAFLKFIS
jgi:hypothetical protein